jgi:hypothetical protein
MLLPSDLVLPVQLQLHQGGEALRSATITKKVKPAAVVCAASEYGQEQADTRGPPTSDPRAAGPPPDPRVVGTPPPGAGSGPPQHPRTSPVPFPPLPRRSCHATRRPATDGSKIGRGERIRSEGRPDPPPPVSGLIYGSCWSGPFLRSIWALLETGLLG